MGTDVDQPRNLAKIGHRRMIVGADMADWSAALYVKFEDERTRPAREFGARVRAAAPACATD